MKHKSFVASAASGVLKKNRLLTAALLLFIIASMLLQLVPAFIMRKIIDDNFSRGVFQGVWLLAVWYLLAMAGTNIIEFLKVVITTILGQRILNELRLRMAKRLSGLSMRYFTKTPVGDIMSRLTTDVDAINTLFSAGIIGVITDSFKIIGLLVSLYIVAPKLIWLEIIAIPGVYLLSNYFRKNIFKQEKNVRACVAEIYTFIQEWLHGIKTVKAYALESIGEERFAKPLNKHLNAVNAISLYDSWFPCVMQTLKAVIIVLSLWFGVKNGTVLSLALTTGTLAAVCDLISRLFAPIEALATEFQTIQQAMAGISRVKEFMNEPAEDRLCLPQSADFCRGIEINNVYFEYEKEPVLKGVTVDIPQGEKAVFAGRSGAGKTILMNIVAGLYRPASGTVRICGVDPYTLPPFERRRLIGIVPQMPQIFNGTIKDNIALHDDSIADSDIEHAADTVGLHDVIMKLPNRYSTFIGEGSAGLSGGEVQLLALARAIAANPKILLLDEPTSGMDSKTEKQVFAAIRQAGEGRTILSISHRLGGIVDANIVHLMAGGKIVESGAAHVLAQKDGWYSMYTKIEAAGWNLP